MIELNKIYNMDCVEGMKLLPDSFIDLTVTSPPYDNLRTYKGFTWDFESTAEELYRVTKEGGVVVWVVGDATINGSETGTSFKQALYFMDIGFNLHDTMIYHKVNSPPVGGKNRYYNAFEYMFVLSKGTPRTFNYIQAPRLNKWNDMRISRFRGVTRNSEGEFVKKEVKVNKIVKLQNVWSYMVGGGISAEDKITFEHPAVFPEQLAKDHIISWSNEGDIVLDPFMGSGTTAKMAILSNREYIGFELSEEYCEIARDRIDIYEKQVTMFDLMGE